MKKLCLKFIVIILTSAFAAGVIFCSGFAFRVPSGVEVDGAAVGGLTYSAASRIIRRAAVNGLAGKRLVIYAGERTYAFEYPQIDFVDNVSGILHESKKGGKYTSVKRYYLKGADDIARAICGGVSREMNEPYALFNAEGEPFTYYEGNDGRICRADVLLKRINYSLNNGFTPIYASFDVVPRTKTTQELRENTRLLCSFYTCYDEGNAARANNISLACRALNGVIIAPYGDFSFNAVVGERTAARGYKTAKIISGGRYVAGLGGGVCQVSTTLYNAVLLSGLEVTEQHPHTLAVGYVDPSRDAMVSGDYFDFKFKNNRGYPVFIRAEAAGGRVTCSVYGRGDGWKYSFLSEVTKLLPPPEPETGASADITARDGVESEGYLIKEKNGLKIKTLVRRDSYAPLRGAVRGSGVQR